MNGKGSEVSTPGRLARTESIARDPPKATLPAPLEAAAPNAARAAAPVKPDPDPPAPLPLAPPPNKDGSRFVLLGVAVNLPGSRSAPPLAVSLARRSAASWRIKSFPFPPSVAAGSYTYLTLPYTPYLFFSVAP